MNNIILVGNPNTGKTTLFNTMTNSNRKASNWHGVTVDVVSKKYKYGGEEYNVADIPGIYSLSSNSKEEEIASKYLCEHKGDLIVNICDSNNLKRNLILTLELLKQNYNVIIVVNMSGENKSYDLIKLSKLLKIEIYEIDARKKKSIDKLKNNINKYLKNKKTQNSSKIIENQLKFGNLDEIIKIIKKDNIFDSYKKTIKADKIILNKFLFLPIFLLVIFSVFFITFGPVGNFVLGIVEWLLSKFFGLISSAILKLNISQVVARFLIDGVFGSAITVLSFVPQIVILMFFLNLLEDTGYMSRVAFMFDGVLKKFGLNGKSLFSLMMGFGCTTSAVMTTRNLPSKNLRKRTALLLPFMSCTAKLPIFLVISSLFFEKYKFLFVFLLYIFAILISLIFSAVYKRFIPDEKTDFILEMPKYRIPNLKKVTMDSLSTIKEFLIKVGSLILLFTSIAWVLQNFSVSFKFLNGENFSQSILYFISSKLTFLFNCIGLGNAGTISAILLGLVAKELIVVGLCLINGVTGSISLLSESLILESSICHFSPISSMVFLVFILLYSPCISAIISIKNEFGTKTALYVFFAQFALSFAVSFLVYRIFLNPKLIYFVVGAIILDIVVQLVIKFGYKKNNKWGRCNECMSPYCKQKSKVVSKDS